LTKSKQRSRGRFVLFCESGRQQRYLEVIDATSHAVALAGSVIDVTRECLTNPPDALIIDLVSGIHARETQLGTILAFDMAWPIVRAKALRGEEITIISTDPVQSGSFEKALDAIARGDPVWRRLGLVRRHVRLPIRCRARCREATSEQWVLGTTLDLHAQGCFVLTFDPFPPDTTLELELRDLHANELLIEARVAWTRRWEDSVSLPGMGLSFVPATVPASLLAYLSDPQSWIGLFE